MFDLRKKIFEGFTLGQKMPYSGVGGTQDSRLVFVWSISVQTTIVGLVDPVLLVFKVFKSSKTSHGIVT